ncbi:hypothetical protein [Paenibacillus sp. HGF5]|uniref:hypothetical protein n=1 Tax=Paenibacillus sp. HGF5 TaxID=908341 RepID=UPI0002072665|nr:hypothetical protein [Paenibacillus sp. HGF5]EGG33418.1 conserved domain protein [Paenibacillus sp. HGF5]
MGGKVRAKMIDGALCIATSELCEVFNVHRNTIAQWERNGMPKKARGWYSLKDTIKWVTDNRGVKKNPDDEEGMTLSQQKLKYEAQLKEQQAEAATLKNAISKGEYIRREDVVSELQRFFISLRRSMGGFSRKIAMEISPYLEPEQVRLIEQNIADTTNAALLQLSVRGVYDAKKD